NLIQEIEKQWINCSNRTTTTVHRWRLDINSIEQMMLCSSPNMSHNGDLASVLIPRLGEVVSRPPEADRTTIPWCYIATSWEMERRWR
ncbi:hypothetical protein A2U01_0075546, partial [Trifolium medium]|nr:hypothetical protein [Trifolium medium]